MPTPPTFAAESTWIPTASGGRFDLLAPRADDVRLCDIAHALSHAPRFSGQTRVFYSVAQHSVEVSLLCDPTDALAGLLHDASEAYVCDLPRPLKHSPLLTGYRAAEQAVQNVIAVHFGIAPEKPASVARADAVAVAVEVRDLLRSGECTSAAPAHLPPARLIPWSPLEARRQFLARFAALTASLTASR